MKKSSAVDELSLPARKQESMREAICEPATRLLLAHGYQATTIDDIARAARIGRRTFFRYFESKEDVVLWKFDQFARCVVACLGARPAREPPLLALQKALIEASEFYNQDPDETLAVLRLTAATPSLYAQQLVQQQRWKAWFAEALRRRARASRRALGPELTAAVGLEAMATAVRRWVDDPSVALTVVLADCFARLRKVVADQS